MIPVSIALIGGPEEGLSSKAVISSVRVVLSGEAGEFLGGLAGTLAGLDLFASALLELAEVLLRLLFSSF